MKMLKFYVTLRKSTGESQNRCVQRSLNGPVTAERCRGNENPRRSNKRTFVRILSDDFAAVDLREEPCNNGLPEKGKLTEEGPKGTKGTNNKTVRRAAKDKAAVLQAGQRKTPCPPPRVLLP